MKKPSVYEKNPRETSSTRRKCQPQHIVVEDGNVKSKTLDFLLTDPQSVV